MLEEVKLALRIKSTALDEDINGLIDACKADMRIAGIRAPDVAEGAAITKPIIKRAIILYCKADYNVDDSAERYLATYENLKAALSLSSESDAADGDSDD